jgi:5-methylthioadenosine/S-adenosylhomocysteine deaminase
MATLNGARALGLESITGSLVAGKEADMVAVNMDFLETQPLYDVISHLVYATGRSQVSDVWAAGRALLREGELVTLDTAAIRERTTEWQDKISSS